MRLVEFSLAHRIPVACFSCHKINKISISWLNYNRKQEILLKNLPQNQSNLKANGIYSCTGIYFFKSAPPLRKLIFGHYILSFPLFYHTSSGITQITFLNAPSKSPYKQMQSLTRNNHITSNHLPLLLFTPSKDIFIRTFSIVALFSYSNVSIAVYTRTTSL